MHANELCGVSTCNMLLLKRLQVCVLCQMPVSNGKGSSGAGVMWDRHLGSGNFGAASGAIATARGK